MKNKIIFGMIFLIILSNLALAIDTFYETNAVGRIVGESPNEYIKQLKSNEINIESATIFNANYFLDKKDNILKKQFDDVNYKTYYNDNIIENQLYEMKKNELLILETEAEFLDNKKLLEYPYPNNEKDYPFNSNILTIDDTKNWQEAFEIYNPLFIFDAPYAGAYLPKQDSFISRLTADASIIAPSSINSDEFIKSFICNLEDDLSIGEIFRNARNFHYNGGSKSSQDNYIALVLQSYMLYADPTQKININNYIIDSDLKKWCKNYLENMELGVEFLREEDNKSIFRKTLEFNINTYNITQIDNFDIIEIPGLFNVKENYQIIEPLSIRRTQFPANSIFLNYRIEEISNPEDIFVNLPTYLNSNYTNRTCYEDFKNTSIEFSETFQDNNHYFIANIYPIEIVNCSQGHFRIYKKFKYSIDYYTPSPITIKSIENEQITKPQSYINISIETMKISQDSEFGSLVIYDENNNIVAEKEFFSQETKHNLTIQTPKEEGFYRYSIEYQQNNKTLLYQQISIQNKYFSYFLDIPIIFRNIQKLPLYISYKYDEKFLNISYLITHKNITIYENNFSIIPNKDIFTIDLDFPELQIKNEPYELTLFLKTPKKEIKENYLLYTNNKPILKVSYPEYIYELEDFKIEYSINDKDNDELTIEINDSKFEKINNTFLLKSNYEDHGNYSVNIQLKDNYYSTKKTIDFEIKKSQKPMTLNLTLINSKNNLITDIEEIELYKNEIYYNTYYIENSTLNILLEHDNPKTTYNDGFVYNDNITFKIIGHNTNRIYKWNNNISINENLILNENELNDTNLIFIIETNKDYDLNENLIVNLNIKNEYKNIFLNETFEIFDLNMELESGKKEELFFEYSSNYSIIRNYNISYLTNGKFYIKYTLENENFKKEFLKEITIYDSNIQSPPKIENIEIHGGYIGGYSTIKTIATDINDDNLTIYYSWPFEDNNTKYFGLSDIGNYTINVSVTDGLFTQIKEFNFEIKKKNEKFIKIIDGIIKKNEYINNIDFDIIEIINKNNIIIKNISYKIGGLNE